MHFNSSLQLVVSYSGVAVGGLSRPGPGNFLLYPCSLRYGVSGSIPSNKPIETCIYTVSRSCHDCRVPTAWKSDSGFMYTRGFSQDLDHASLATGQTLAVGFWPVGLWPVVAKQIRHMNLRAHLATCPWTIADFPYRISSENHGWVVHWVHASARCYESASCFLEKHGKHFLGYR